jgi:hypothetical protein
MRSDDDFPIEDDTNVVPFVLLQQQQPPAPVDVRSYVLGDTAEYETDPSSVGRLGAYRLTGDYWHEQFQFFRAIQTELNEVLVDLQTSVLPHFIAARNRGGAYPGYADSTWAAIWHWAGQFQLVEAKDVQHLADPNARSIAAKMDDDYMFRCDPSASIEGFERNSSAVVFGLGALNRVVMRTLRVWSDTLALPPLEWSYPGKVLTVYDTSSEEQLVQANQELLEGGYLEFLESGQVKTPDPPPYYYSIRVRAWNLRRENQAEAISRIEKEFRTVLKEAMNRHEAIADKVSLERHPRKVNTDHYKWLALYQVKGLSYEEVTKLVHPRRGDKDISFDDLKKTVYAGIQDAAELVAGPSYKSWLRESKPGHPRKNK